MPKWKRAGFVSQWLKQSNEVRQQDERKVEKWVTSMVGNI